MEKQEQKCLNCMNSFCPNKAFSNISLQFTCEFCKTRQYCSRNCLLEDWNMGHDKICYSLYNEKIIYLEKISPFLTSGIVLPPIDTKNMLTKIDQILEKYEKYNIEGRNTCVLGKGSYGQVFLMRNKANKQQIAMKIIEKKYIGSPNMLKSLTREIEIHKSLLHENIIKLHEHAEDKKYIYLVMEYAAKGSLFQFIKSRGKIPEKEAFYFFVQACNAVYFLHKQKLIHRDIKPENMLITGEGKLKLCDFGCCTPCDSDGRRTFCGTIEYMAPEVVKRDGYKEKADVWSLGVLLYEMLHGHSPFHGTKDQDTMNKIVENKLEIADFVPMDTKEVIIEMLNENPLKRPAIVEVMGFKWVKRMQKEFGIEDRICEEIYKDEIKKIVPETKIESIPNENSIESSKKEDSKLSNNKITEFQNDTNQEKSLNNSLIEKSQILLKKVEVDPILEPETQKDPKIEEGIQKIIEQEIIKTEPIQEKIDSKIPNNIPESKIDGTDIQKIEQIKENPTKLPETEERKGSIRFSSFTPEKLLQNNTIKLDYELNIPLAINRTINEHFNKSNEKASSLKNSPNIQNESPSQIINFSLEKGKTLEEIKAELNKKLLINAPISETDDLNTSYTSDDYALSRSESLMKAVYYLDDLDCGAKPDDLIKRVKEIEQENRTLKKVCASFKSVIVENKEIPAKAEILNEIPRDVLYAYPSVQYKESMNKMIDALIEQKSKPNNENQFKSRVQLMSVRKSVSETQVNKKRETRKSPEKAKKGFWSKLFSFGDTNEL